MTPARDSSNVAERQHGLDREFLCAVFSRDLTRVEKAVAAGANINACDARGEPMLFSAVRLFPQTDIAAFLIQAGASLGAHDFNGWTLLHQLIKAPSSGLVQMALDHGHAVDATDRDGRTAIFDAVEREYPALVAVLLKAGANPNHRNNWKQTPLHLANTPEMVELLVAAGADLDPRDGVFFTPLLAAAVNLKVELSTCLIRHGASLRALGSDREGVLAAVVNRTAPAGTECGSLVEVLCQAGADLEEKGARSATPLLVAASNGALNISRILIAHGADPEARDDNGLTPLLAAAAGGKTETMLLLLESGADPLALDAAGRGLDALAYGRPSALAALASWRARSSVRSVIGHARQTRAMKSLDS